MNRYFKHILSVWLICFGFIMARAQQNHFIYLQTENKQSFYIKLDKKILSSSASGYLIIPKLTDGSYTLTLGFPKNEWPEQKVTCLVDKKDAGYILKNFGEKGWGLFNWQTMNVVMADKKSEDPVIAEVKKEIQQAPQKPVVIIDPNATKPAEIKAQEPAKPVTVVSRLLTNKTADGIEMIFIDAGNGLQDTIRIIIPVEKKQESATAPLKQEEVKKAEKETEPATKKEIVAPVNDSLKAEEKKEVIKETSQILPEAEIKTSVKTDKEEKEANQAVNKPVLQNSDCKAFATEEDFMKLRKKMVGESTDDDMVSVAKKIFKSKCFTVEQVKNLSVLFLNDPGKYKFFDAAYPFVSDSYNFSSLEKLLTDEYYINRFKAMIRH